MDDLISRQAAIDTIEKTKTVISKDGERYVAKINAQQNIALLPSAQPEIIRCKDCKFWTHIKRTKRYWCNTDDGLYDLNPSPNDYCSRAERRTDETD